MFRPHHPPHRPDRRGAILLVVLTLLALFAVIGLSFVLYAESEANAARIHRVAANRTADEPPNPDDVAGEIVSQILFGADERSAVHGHDLASLKYGGDTSVERTTPYTGVGLFHEQVNIVGPPGVPLFRDTGVLQFDRAEAINFSVWENPNGNASYTTKFDPERTKGNGSLRTGNPLAWPATTPPAAEIYVPKNAPYTYPDRNNALLAMINTLRADDTANNPTGVPSGQVLLPSGHRPRLFDPAGEYGPFGLALRGPNGVNANWFVPAGRFKLLRPRSVDHLTAADLAGLSVAERGAYTALFTAAPISQPQLNLLAQAAEQGRLGQFPVPAFNADGSVTGDVQNYKFPEGPQRNDSVWMDLNLPLVKYRGKSYRPLVAPLLIALDGRVNTNVAGNLLGTAGTTHASHSGFGPHEINLAKVLMLAQAQEVGPPVIPDRVAKRAQAIIQRRFNGLTTPTPRELPSTADAIALAGTGTPGTHYPNYPTPATVYAVHPFQPLARPATVQPSGTNSVLAVNQYAVPTGSQINWNALGQKPVPPGGDPAQPRFGVTPFYTGYDNSQFTAADPTAMTPPQGALLNHPLGWNPYSRDRYSNNSAANGVGLFPTSDARRLLARWSDKDSNLAQAYMASQTDFNNEFRGSTPNSPSSRTRALTTPNSNHTKFPGVAPNFFGDPAVKLDLAAGQRTPVLSAAPTLSIPAITTAGAPSYGASDASAFADATHNQRLGNVRAALAAVDLNRPLADYRAVDPSTGVPTGQLNNTNVGNELPARLDRQAFAYDIFLRLAVATGASIRYENGSWLLPQPATPPTFTIATTPPVTVQDTEYNALRWLAQLAANIVDAVDPDDVSTAFVWNPLDPNGATNPTLAQDPANYSLTPETTNNQPAINNRVVFGTEKPRLVLNEVYGEIANDTRDAGSTQASQPFQARFFVGLLSPTNADAASIQPDRVPLTYRAPTAYSVYKIQVYDDDSTAPNVRRSFDAAQSPANVTGRVTGPAPGFTPVQPKLDCTLTNLQVVGTAPAVNAESVEANDGDFAASGADRNGFAVVGPQITPAPADDKAFNPDPATVPVFGLMVQKPMTNSPPTTTTPIDDLAYYLARETDADIGDATKPTGRQLSRPHAVVLRRLANPYLDPHATPYSAANPNPTNPYVTVDVVNDVKLFDAIRVASPAPNGTRGTPPTPANHASVGRVQPYAGFQSGANMYDTTMTTKAVTLTLAQQQSANGTMQKQTFFQHNSAVLTPATAASIAAPGDATLDFPFVWMPHFDRRLINQAELLNVAAGMPHELTQRFAVIPTGLAVKFHEHALEVPLRERRPADAAAGALPVFPPLYRAMEYLTVKPWTRDNPEGGRTAGKINVNMIWDEAVFMALLDEQAGNYFTQAERQEMWTQFKASRTPNYPNLGNTADEVAAGPGVSDRPFKSFGVGRFDGGGNLVTPPPGTPPFGIEDTLLRKTLATATTAVPTPVPGNPPLFSRYTATGVRVPPAGDPDAVHPYAESEMLRKVLNNVTTTSDTFLLTFTVGYFECRTEPATPSIPILPIVLGREVYNQVPGDLRKQYTTVLDRSNLFATPPAPNSDGSAGAPWVAELQNRIGDPTTGLPANTTVRPQLLLPVGLDQSGWGGAGLPPPDAQGKYRAAPGAPPPDGEYPITPQYIDGNLTGRQRQQVIGRYEGRPFELQATFDPSSPGNSTGTLFAVGPKGLNVGIGDRQATLRAIHDGTTPWTYDPLNGRVRITARVETSGLAEYPAGSMLSNVTFGLPAGASPKFELNAPPNPAVPFFGELRP